MKSIFRVVRALWTDECGAILSAEAAMLGTVGVIGAGAGLSAVAESVDSEMKDVAFAIRSLDQSYSFNGMGDRCECSKAWTAGSSFTQQSVEESHAELNGFIQELESAEVESTEAGEEAKDAPVLKSQPVKPKEATKKADAKKREQMKRAEAERKAAKAKRDAERKKRMESKKKESRKKKQDAYKRTAA